MRPTFAKGNRTAIPKLLELRRQAQKDKEPRVVLRIQGILMSLEGVTAGEISNHLKVHRSTVPLWIDHWNRHGQKGLWEGHRSGRPRGLSPEEREKLCDILDSGPTAYGLETGIWTSPRVRQVIAEEFGQQYHPGMCASCCSSWATRCNGPPLGWFRPISSSIANGCATPTRI